MHPTGSMILDEAFDYKHACDYVEVLAGLGSKPGFARIRGLCSILGDPQDDLRFIHIAGTNGKGSTAAFISSVLADAHIRTGTYYSPAVSTIRDHFMINGSLISEREYADCVSQVAAANEKLINETNESATQFEFETALAFVYFRKNHCDAVVLECGMGGRDDATNIVRNKICCVFASISYDHMQYLGDTLCKIADVKSGIITSDCPVIILDSSKEATGVIRQKCEKTGSRLYVVDPSDIRSTDEFPQGQKVTYAGISDAAIRLNGAFQPENAALAIKTLQVIGQYRLIPECVIDEDTIRSGLKKTKWPFRFECISTDPPVFVDGAHNEEAAVKLAKTIRNDLAGYETVLVMGMFADKEYEKAVAILAPLAKAVITVETPDNPRALPAQKLAECALLYCSNVHACSSITDACRLALDTGDAVVACGSLSYLKKFFDALQDIKDENQKHRI